MQQAGCPVIAVNDAYKLFPFADVLYAADGVWWEVHKGVPGFAGEKWTTQSTAEKARMKAKAEIAKRYGLNMIEGSEDDGFSLDPSKIHHGSNSGFQGVNLAILFGGARLILLGFDMTLSRKGRHFFGDHPSQLRNTRSYGKFKSAFDRAAKKLPAHIQIINATMQSALTCFPKVPLHDALSDTP